MQHFSEEREKLIDEMAKYRLKLHKQALPALTLTRVILLCASCF